MKRPLTALLGLLLSVSACAQSSSPSTTAQAPNVGAAPSFTIQAPEGFKVSVYADGFKAPRLLAVAPNGDIFLSDTGAGTVYVLPDRNKDGKPDSKAVFASGLSQPHGLAFHGNALYVANTNAVVRFPYKSGDLKATGPAEKLVDLPSGAGHSTRTVVFGPDDRMYVATGSSCNVCEESDPKRAAVWVFDADGKNGKVYASGLRNSVGLAWQGTTLYASMNGRDQLGDNVPPEAFFKLSAGGFYGWPYCYTLNGEQTYDKDFGRKTAAVCDTAKPAFATVTAHSAPLGINFYTGKAFPSAYQGMLFAALHGSWNRSEKSGYKVVMIDPKSGKVTDFLTGFLNGQQVNGRPVAVVTAADGSMLLTDDGNGTVYRITYTK
ncbi:sorbosone dehydrogenase family protein [Deinococcus sonorensis]|uniref:Sorbosone dehydrogenase family protein n=2 Tax=Deinococcus sonorensis TaxID=309891 RepID=A0AAU7U9J3_9DEIO